MVFLLALFLLLQLSDLVKGTIQCVIADNLGAHEIAGLTENFVGEYICRFCLAQKSEIQQKEVSSDVLLSEAKRHMKGMLVQHRAM